MVQSTNRGGQPKFLGRLFAPNDPLAMPRKNVILSNQVRGKIYFQYIACAWHMPCIVAGSRQVQ